MQDPSLFPYTSGEERIHVWTHGIAGLATAVGTAWMVASSQEPSQALTLALYGLSVCFMFLSSTVYHSAEEPRTRAAWLVADYASIYLVIAGSYTPFASLVLDEGVAGASVLALMWGLAALGVLSRLLNIRMAPWLSTGLYVAMGWSGAPLVGPLIEALPLEALALVVGGGVAYSVGAAFYLWRSLPYNHAIWHVFVVLGAGIHFLAVWRYVAGL